MSTHTLHAEYPEDRAKCARCFKVFFIPASKNSPALVPGAQWFLDPTICGRCGREDLKQQLAALPDPRPFSEILREMWMTVAMKGEATNG